MNSRRFALIGLLTTWGLRTFAQDKPVVDLRISSDGDELRFVPDRLICRTNTRVRLSFHHAGEISSDPHDWVLLKPGAEKKFLADADMQAEDIVIPPHDDEMVLAATPLCAKGQTVSTEFTAPAPGRYVFICSIAGHGDTMQGILTVTS